MARILESTVDRAIHLDIDRFQAYAAHHWLAASADENFVGFYLRAVVGVNGDRTGRDRTLDARDEAAMAYVDAGVLEGLRHEVTSERLCLAKQSLARHQHGRLLGAQGVHGLGHLAGDRPAADHNQALWRLLGAGHLPVSPRVCVPQARQVRDVRVTAGSQDHGMPCLQAADAALGSRYLGPQLPGEASLTPEERCRVVPDAAHHCRVVSVEDKVVAPGEHGFASIGASRATPGMRSTSSASSTGSSIALLGTQP